MELRLLSKYFTFTAGLSETSQTDLDTLRKAAQLAATLSPFPHKNSCGIVDGVMVIVFDANAVQHALNRADLQP